MAEGLDPGDVPPATYPTLDSGRRAVAFVEAVLASNASGHWEALAAS